VIICTRVALTNLAIALWPKKQASFPLAAQLDFPALSHITTTTTTTTIIPKLFGPGARFSAASLSAEQPGYEPDR